jgi:hypothetical protein
MHLSAEMKYFAQFDHGSFVYELGKQNKRLVQLRRKLKV